MALHGSHVDYGHDEWRRSVQAGSAFLSFGSQGRLHSVTCPPAKAGVGGTSR